MVLKHKTIKRIVSAAMILCLTLTSFLSAFAVYDTGEISGNTVHFAVTDNLNADSPIIYVNEGTTDVTIREYVAKASEAVLTTDGPEVYFMLGAKTSEAEFKKIPDVVSGPITNSFNYNGNYSSLNKELSSSDFDVTGYSLTLSELHLACLAASAKAFEALSPKDFVNSYAEFDLNLYNNSAGAVTKIIASNPKMSSAFGNNNLKHATRILKAYDGYIVVKPAAPTGLTSAVVIPPATSGDIIVPDADEDEIKLFNVAGTEEVDEAIIVQDGDDVKITAPLGTYTVKKVVTLTTPDWWPDGQTVSSELGMTEIASDASAQIEIKSVEIGGATPNPAAISVSNGVFTDETIKNHLASTIKATITLDGVPSNEITIPSNDWNVVGYPADGKTPGDYAVTGTIAAGTLLTNGNYPEGISLPEAKTVNVTVTVKPPITISDDKYVNGSKDTLIVEVPYGTTEANAIKAIKDTIYTITASVTKEDVTTDDVEITVNNWVAVDPYVGQNQTGLIGDQVFKGKISSMSGFNDQDIEDLGEAANIFVEVRVLPAVVDVKNSVAIKILNDGGEVGSNAEVKLAAGVYEILLPNASYTKVNKIVLAEILTKVKDDIELYGDATATITSDAGKGDAELDGTMLIVTVENDTAVKVDLKFTPYNAAEETTLKLNVRLKATSTDKEIIAPPKDEETGKPNLPGGSTGGVNNDPEKTLDLGKIVMGIAIKPISDNVSNIQVNVSNEAKFGSDIEAVKTVTLKLSDLGFDFNVATGGSINVNGTIIEYTNEEEFLEKLAEQEITLDLENPENNYIIVKSKDDVETGGEGMRYNIIPKAVEVVIDSTGEVSVAGSNLDTIFATTPVVSWPSNGGLASVQVKFNSDFESKLDSSKTYYVVVQLVTNGSKRNSSNVELLAPAKVYELDSSFFAGDGVKVNFNDVDASSGNVWITVFDKNPALGKVTVQNGIEKETLEN